MNDNHLREKIRHQTKRSDNQECEDWSERQPTGKPSLNTLPKFVAGDPPNLITKGAIHDFREFTFDEAVFPPPAKTSDKPPKTRTTNLFTSVQRPHSFITERKEQRPLDMRVNSSRSLGTDGPFSSSEEIIPYSISDTRIRSRSFDDLFDDESFFDSDDSSSFFDHHNSSDRAEFRKREATCNGFDDHSLENSRPKKITAEDLKNDMKINVVYCKPITAGCSITRRRRKLSRCRPRSALTQSMHLIPTRTRDCTLEGKDTSLSITPKSITETKSRSPRRSEFSQSMHRQSPPAVSHIAVRSPVDLDWLTSDVSALGMTQKSLFRKPSIISVQHASKDEFDTDERYLTTITKTFPTATISQKIDDARRKVRESEERLQLLMKKKERRSSMPSKIKALLEGGENNEARKRSGADTVDSAASEGDFRVVRSLSRKERGKLSILRRTQARLEGSKDKAHKKTLTEVSKTHPRPTESQSLSPHPPECQTKRETSIRSSSITHDRLGFRRQMLQGMLMRSRKDDTLVDDFSSKSANRLRDSYRGRNRSSSRDLVGSLMQHRNHRRVAPAYR